MVFKVLINFCFVICFLFIFTCEALLHRGYSHHLLLYIFENLPWLIAVRICRRNLPWEFVARSCRGYLLREFAARICRENLSWLFCHDNMPQELALANCRGTFVSASKLFFVYVSKSCFHENKPFYLLDFFY